MTTIITLSPKQRLQPLSLSAVPRWGIHIIQKQRPDMNFWTLSLYSGTTIHPLFLPFFLKVQFTIFSSSWWREQVNPCSLLFFPLDLTKLLYQLRRQTKMKRRSMFCTARGKKCRYHKGSISSFNVNDYLWHVKQYLFFKFNQMKTYIFESRFKPARESQHSASVHRAPSQTFASWDLSHIHASLMSQTWQSVHDDVLRATW